MTRCLPAIDDSGCEAEENRRSLGFAPNEQKINPIESISISSVHFTLNLPQASRLLGMTKGRVATPFGFGERGTEPQISPLRYAPVEMTNLFEDEIPRFQEKTGAYLQQNCHLDRRSHGPALHPRL
jgi:hypothetical protein